MRAINVFLRNQELATEDKIALQLGEVIGVMEGIPFFLVAYFPLLENIGKVTERGEKLHVLQDKIGKYHTVYKFFNPFLLKSIYH